MTVESVEIVEGGGRELVEVVLPSAPLQVVEVVIPDDQVLEVAGPTDQLEVVEVLSDADPELVEIEVPGPQGSPGPVGPPGPQGPPGEVDLDIPSLTLLFENGLI